MRLGQTMREGLRFSPLPARTNVLLVAVAMGVLALGLTWRLVASQRVAMLTSALDQAVNTAAAVETLDSRARGPEPGYVGTLPESVDLESIVARVQARAAGSGVAIVSLTTEHVPATARTLGRHTISCTLKGTFDQLVSLLSQLPHTPPDTLVVTNLRIERGSADASALDARVDLVWLSKPGEDTALARAPSQP